MLYIIITKCMSIKKYVLQYYISTASTYAYASSIIYIYIYMGVSFVLFQMPCFSLVSARICVFFRTCVIIRARFLDRH